MNSFNHYYNWLFFEQLGGQQSIGIFPGAFKPPHMGHFYTALNACKDNDEVYIFVSKKPRALSTQNIATPKGAKDCDINRYSNFMKNDKYTSNLASIGPAGCERLTSASALRAAISLKDKNTIFKNVPDMVDKQAIYDVLMQSNNPEADNYGHISIQQTMTIWDSYRSALAKNSKLDESKIKIIVSDISPVKDTYDLVNNINQSDVAANTNVKLYVGE